MKIAYILFNELTILGFIGIYDPISLLKSLNYISNLTWNICFYTDSISDNFGLEIKLTKIRESLTNYDIVIIPGGFGAKNYNLTLTS
jgi:hypothetical protein